MPGEITVEVLKEKLDGKEKIVLVDCREQDEYDFCRIEGSVFIPLSEFEDRAENELDQDAEIFIHCHHGGRSLKACLFLEELGYENVSNVVGGIEQWSLRVDPKVPRY